MPIFDNIGGVQRQVAKSYSNINGVYREDSKVYDNVAGVWREAHSSGLPCTASITTSKSGHSVVNSILTGERLTLYNQAVYFYSESASANTYLHLVLSQNITYSTLSLLIEDLNATFQAYSGDSQRFVVWLLDDVNTNNYGQMWFNKPMTADIFSMPNPFSGSAAFSGSSNKFTIQFGTAQVGSLANGGLLQTLSDILISNISIGGVKLALA